MQKGFTPLMLLIGLVLIIGIAGGVYYFGVLKNKSQSQIVTSLTTPSPSSSDQTANWKTYTNGKYGYTIKYPNGYQDCGKNETSFDPELENSCSSIPGSIPNFEITVNNPGFSFNDTNPLFIDKCYQITSESIEIAGTASKKYQRVFNKDNENCKGRPVFNDESIVIQKGNNTYYFYLADFLDLNLKQNFLSTFKFTQ